MFKVKQPTMRETAFLYLRCWWAKHFGPMPERSLVLYPHEFRKRYIEPAIASLFEERDPMVTTIPGWKTAIFYDATGKPYWRSDGKPLSDPQPKD